MIDDIMFTNTILNNDHLCGVVIEDTIKCNDFNEKSANENLEKNSFVWTVDFINILLKLYDSKLAMLTTPKKKTKIWMAISDDLKDYNIEVSPDQVRWKINALTRKYKQCIDSKQHKKFKYFTQLNNIYVQYNLNCYTKAESLKKNDAQEDLSQSGEYGIQPESKSIIELRKTRLANKIESDICQSKVQLEKQWLEYLKIQEEQRLVQYEICKSNLKLRQAKFDFRKRKLEVEESLEIRRMQLMKKEQEQVIKVGEEKCEIMRKLFK